MATTKLGRCLYTCCRLSFGLRPAAHSCRSLGLAAWKRQLHRSSVALTARSYSSESGESYRYMISHEWAKLDGSTATVGISRYAQDKLGEIVFVELPEVGKELSKADQFGVLESVKAAADIYSPMSGTVTEVNTALVEEPELINKDPFDRGWIMKLEVSDKSEHDELMSQAEYEKHISDGD